MPFVLTGIGIVLLALSITNEKQTIGGLTLVWLYYFQKLFRTMHKKEEEPNSGDAIKDSENESQENLERATKLLARGKKKEAIAEYRAIIVFYPNTKAANIAQSYIEHEAEITHET